LSRVVGGGADVIIGRLLALPITACRVGVARLTLAIGRSRRQAWIPPPARTCGEPRPGGHGDPRYRPSSAHDIRRAQRPLRDRLAR